MKKEGFVFPLGGVLRIYEGEQPSEADTQKKGKLLGEYLLSGGSGVADPNSIVRCEYNPYRQTGRVLWHKRIEGCTDDEGELI